MTFNEIRIHVHEAELIIVLFRFSVIFSTIFLSYCDSVCTVGSQLLEYCLTMISCPRVPDTWSNFPPSHVLLTLDWPVLIPTECSSTFYMLSKRQLVPFLKSLIWLGWESNLQPPGHQADALSIESLRRTDHLSSVYFYLFGLKCQAKLKKTNSSKFGSCHVATRILLGFHIFEQLSVRYLVLLPFTGMILGWAVLPKFFPHFKPKLNIFMIYRSSKHYQRILYRRNA